MCVGAIEERREVCPERVALSDDSALCDGIALAEQRVVSRGVQDLARFRVLLTSRGDRGEIQNVKRDAGLDRGTQILVCQADYPVREYCSFADG